MRRIGEKLAGPGIAALVGVGALVAYIVPGIIHRSWPELETPLIFVSLAVGMGLFVGAARTRAYTAGFLLFGGMMVLLFCGSLAAIHGWGVAVAIVSPLAALGFGIFIRWIIGRPVQRALELNEEEAAVFGETYLPPPVPVPGEATEIYASQAKVARTAVVELIVLAIAGGLLWAFTANGLWAAGDVTMAVVCAIIAILLLWGLGMTTLVLVRRRPAVVLMAEGFIDNVTLGTSGMGYIRWREVLATMPIGKRAQRRLLVIVNDPGAARGRLSPWQKMQVTIVGMHWPTPVGMPEWLLPMRVEELQAHMERRMEATGATIVDPSNNGSDDAIREGGWHGYEFGPHGGSGAFDVAVGGNRGGVMGGGDRGAGDAPDRAPAPREQPAG